MFYEIDIVPSKFKRRVKMPRFYSDPEEPLSLSDVRVLLEFCSNTRLRTYILLLVSSGLRATEAASLRMVDIDMTSGSPTKITVRTEYSKTRRGRTVYCSDEATKHLQKLLEWKYRSGRERGPQDLIFAIQKGPQLQKLYTIKCWNNSNAYKKWQTKTNAKRTHEDVK